jgi:hypothetical protein
MSHSDQPAREDPSEAGSDVHTSAFKRSRCNLAVDNSIQLAARFASMVTVPASENEWVARNGDESLFKVLRQLLPEV